MVKLRTNKKTTLGLIDGGDIAAEHRPYLGMSQLGHSCPRYLWLSFRWAFTDSYSKRIGRLFLRGHNEEITIKAELAKIGVDTYGDQEEVVAGFGHIKGHIDDKAMGVPEAPKTEHLVEYKTMNDKAFKDVSKKKVKASKPIYYAQMQLYMHFMKLTRALFIAVNKNDDAWYVERVRYDKEFAEALVTKGEGIVISTLPMIAMFKRTWYECKWCSASDQCRGDAPLAVNCRTCQHASPELDGKWSCNFTEDTPADLTTYRQRTGCTEHKPIEVV